MTASVPFPADEPMGKPTHAEPTLVKTDLRVVIDAAGGASVRVKMTAAAAASSASVPLRAEAPIFMPPSHVAPPSCQPQLSGHQAPPPSMGQKHHSPTPAHRGFAPPPPSQLEFVPPPPSVAFAPPAHAYRSSPPMYQPPCFMPPWLLHASMVAPPPPQPPHPQPQPQPQPSPTEAMTARWQQQLRLRDSWYGHAHERGGPSPARPAQGTPLRIDPTDGNAYPFEAFVNYYGGTAEWEVAWPVAQLQRVAAPPADGPAYHIAHSRDARRCDAPQRAYSHTHGGGAGPPRQPFRRSSNGNGNANFKSPHRSPRGSPTSCSSPSTSPRTQARTSENPVSGDNRRGSRYGRSRSRLAQADDAQPRRLDYSSLSPAPPTDEHHQLLAVVAAKERENAAALHKAQLELRTARARVRLTTTELVVAQTQAGVNEFLGLSAPREPTAESVAVVAPAADRALSSPPNATAVDGALSCPAEDPVDPRPTQLSGIGASQEAAQSRSDQPAWATELLRMQYA